MTWITWYFPALVIIAFILASWGLYELLAWLDRKRGPFEPMDGDLE